MDIQPGSQVTITVTRSINTANAQKTIARVFLQDPAIRKTRRMAPKKVMHTRRAGRIWNHRPRGSDAVVPTTGESATVQATVDVIRDLQSVSRYIDVK
jgi:hypothetical protein